MPAVTEKQMSSLRHYYPQPIDMCVHNSYDGKDTLWDNWELVKYTPFNPVDKRTVALVKNKATGELIRCSKGAPQVRILTGYRPHERGTDMTQWFMFWSSFYLE
jgi:magnesium-transporting ATPase (P-type)